MLSFDGDDCLPRRIRRGLIEATAPGFHYWDWRTPFPGEFARASLKPGGALAGGARTEVGGEIRLVVESDHPVRTAGLRSRNPDVSLAVETGLSMAIP